MVIKHNISALRAYNNFKFNHLKLDKSFVRIASGERITRAGDDASGLAVSEKMRSYLGSLKRAEKNTEDAISFVQTADGYLSQLADIIHRVRLLGVQASNGIYSEQDRFLMQIEVSQLVDEIDRISLDAEFNGLKLFRGDFAKESQHASMWFHIGPNAHNRKRVFIQTMTAESLDFKAVDSIISVKNPDDANRTIGITEQALEKVSKMRTNLGAYGTRFEIVAKSLMIAHENLQASESRIRDVDIAEEMIQLTIQKMLVDSSLSILAQANATPKTVLQLINSI